MNFLYVAATIFLSISAYCFLDLPIASLASHAPSHLITFFLLITTIATPFAHLFLWSGLTFLGWTRKWNKEFTYRSLQLCLMCGFVLFFAGILKLSLARARPDLFFHDAIYGFYFGSTGNEYRSFPSSHTAIAFGVAWFWRILSSKQLLIPYLLASMVGLSRILINQHYASDVLVGAFIGIFVATAVYSLTERHKSLIVNLLENFNLSNR